MKKKFVIIGAGLAGLTCANLLAENEIDVIIIEKQKMIGGLASGIEENGFSMDIGPHYMVLPKKSKITDKIQDMLGTENLLPFPDFTKSHKAYFNNNLRGNFPTIKEFLNEKGIMFRLNVFLQILCLKIKQTLSKTDYKSGNDYLEKNYGKLLYENWFKYYYSNIFEDEYLPKNFVMNQFSPMQLRKKIKPKTKESLHNSNDNPYFDCYPRFGMASLIKKLDDELSKNNVKLILDSEIKSIERTNDGKIIDYEKNGENFQIIADGIVFGVSPTKALSWFKNVPKEITSEIQKEIAYNAIIVYLFIDQEKIFDGWIINLYDPSFSISRISQQNHLSKNIAPKGQSLLTVEIKCKSSDKIWKDEDNEIFKIVIDEIKRMKLFDIEKILGNKIIRVPGIYPKFDTIKFNDEKLVNFINSYKNEYALSHEFDSSDLISDNVDNGKQYRLGGMLIAISSAYSLVDRIISSLKE